MQSFIEVTIKEDNTYLHLHRGPTGRRFRVDSDYWTDTAIPNMVWRYWYGIEGCSQWRRGGCRRIQSCVEQVRIFLFFLNCSNFETFEPRTEQFGKTFLCRFELDRHQLSHHHKTNRKSSSVVGIIERWLWFRGCFPSKPIRVDIKRWPKVLRRQGVKGGGCSGTDHEAMNEALKKRYAFNPGQ